MEIVVQRQQEWLGEKEFVWCFFLRMNESNSKAEINFEKEAEV